MEIIETIGGLSAFLLLGLYLDHQMKKINAEIEPKEDEKQ